MGIGAKDTDFADAGPFLFAPPDRPRSLELSDLTPVLFFTIDAVEPQPPVRRKTAARVNNSP